MAMMAHEAATSKHHKHGDTGSMLAELQQVVMWWTSHQPTGEMSKLLTINHGNNNSHQPGRYPALKKTNHFKCYLSKTIAYKEDPHWCSVNRASYRGWRSSLCWAVEQKKVHMSVVCSLTWCLTAFTCWWKYLYPHITHCSSCGTGSSKIVSSGCW